MKHTKMRGEQAACLTLSAILLVFYLVSLYQGLNRKASLGYETFYMEQTLCQWPGAKGLLTGKGDTFRFDSQTAAEGQIAGHIPLSPGNAWRTLEGEGWSYVEGTGYCITAWKAELIFDVLPGEYLVTVSVRTDTPGGELTLLLNGEQAASAKLEVGETFLTFPLATSEEPHGRWWLTFILGDETETPFRIQEVSFA